MLCPWFVGSHLFIVSSQEYQNLDPSLDHQFQSSTHATRAAPLKPSIKILNINYSNENNTRATKWSQVIIHIIRTDEARGRSFPVYSMASKGH